MTPEELLKMLDLGGAERVAPPAGAVIAPLDAAPITARHPTALEVDEWGLRRGRELAEESERWQALALGVHAAADFFAAAFDPDPRLRESCVDPRRHEFLTQLLETPEYRELHAATRLDDTASEIAATHFATQFADLAKPDEAGASSAGESGDPMDREMATLRAVGKALVAAREEVGELHETAAALGMGPGMPGTNDPKTVAALFKRVRGDAALQRICELAGRYRRVAQSRQRRKTVHGIDDVVGVEPDGDLAACFLTNSPSSPFPNSNSTLCAAWPSDKPFAANTTPPNRSARDRSWWSSTNRGRCRARRSIPPRRWLWLSPGSPGSKTAGRRSSPTAAIRGNAFSPCRPVGGMKNVWPTG